MILIDTQVWIQSVGSKHPGLDKALADLVRKGDVLGHEFVYGELLLGQGGNARKAVIEGYRDLEQVNTLPHEAVVSFINKHQLANIGIGWVDVHLLAAAHAQGARLWTTDGALLKAATNLKLAYEREKQ